MYIHGGKSNGYHADCYKYNIARKRWTLLKYKSTRQPLARYGHSGVVYQDSLYIFGGYDQHGFCCDRLWRLNLETLRWHEIKYQSPGFAIERFHHAAAVYKSSMVIFSGKSPDGVYDDCLEYSFGTWIGILHCVSWFWP